MTPTEFPRLGPSFLRANSAAQVVSIHRTCLTDPERSREYIAAIASGAVVIDPECLSPRILNCLREIGVPLALIPVSRFVIPPSRSRYPSLSAAFLRGTLPGQIVIAYRSRDLPGVVDDFRRLLADRGAPLDPAGLVRHHIVKLVRMGFPLDEQFVAAALRKPNAAPG